MTVALDFSRLTIEEQRETLALLEESERRKARKKIFSLYPDDGPLRRDLYGKHVAFFAAGAQFHERAGIGANRSGKSLMIAYEGTLHMIGRYPKWWRGRRFDRPVNVWVAGEDSKLVRDSMQVILTGKFDALGAGLIPGDSIVGTTARSGVPEAFDSMTIKNSFGGMSHLTFKSYDQGRESFQAAAVDVILLDEEPPADIYSEALTRTMATVPGQRNGILLAAFTPLKGLSDVVLSYMPGGKPDGVPVSGSKYFIQFGWDDVPHLTDENKAALAASYRPHERAARMRGVPSLGSGAIYPVPEDEIMVDAFEFPAWYRHAYGMDVGWNRTAAVWGALDPESDVLYLYAEHYRGQAEPEIHAAAIKSRGPWIPGVIDPASRGRGQKDGEQLYEIYVAEPNSLTLSIADNGVESGIYGVWSRLSTGRLKVFKGSCPNFLAEFRIYRRDEKGRVVKDNDHAMDAVRYLVSSGIEIAAQRPVKEWKERLGIVPVGGQHVSTYDPMAAMMGGSSTAAPRREREPWMPHQQGR